jgi:hypothetical protein
LHGTATHPDRQPLEGIGANREESGSANVTKEGFFQD